MGVEDGISLPIDLFRRLFTDDLLDLIVEQFSLYAVQGNTRKPSRLDKSKLEQWLGLCLYISVAKILNTRLQWSSFTMRNEKGEFSDKQQVGRNKDEVPHCR